MTSLKIVSGTSDEKKSAIGKTDIIGQSLLIFSRKLEDLQKTHDFRLGND